MQKINMKSMKKKNKMSINMCQSVKVRDKKQGIEKR